MTPTSQLVTMLRTSPTKFYRQGVDTDDELAKGFPSRAEELFSYHGLVIGSIEAAFFAPAQQRGHQGVRQSARRRATHARRAARARRRRLGSLEGG